MEENGLASLRNEVLTGQLSRRELLRRAAILGLSAPVIASLLAACGDESDAPATSEAGATGSSTTPAAAASSDDASPTAAADDDDEEGGDTTSAASSGQRGGGGKLNLLWWQAPTILNPHLSQGTKDFDASRVVLEPLADFNPAGELVPILAAEIPSLGNGVAEDGMSVTWRLKEDVVWSDGEPFTADDVRFTYEYVIDEGTTATTSGNYTVIESVEVVDDHTVTIHFLEPNPAWFSTFVGIYGMILPEHILADYVGERARDAEFNLMPVGTGAYKVDDFRPGDVVVYSINESYRDPDKPFFDQVEMKGGGDATSAARAAVQTGEADFAWNLQVQESILAQLESDGVGVISTTEGVNVERILVNMTDPNTEVNGERSSLEVPHPWQSDLRVRQAYGLAVERDVIANELYGRGGVATPNILVAPPKFVSQDTSWEYDLDRAAELLDEAGWQIGPDGLREQDGVQMRVLFSTTVNPVRQSTQEIVKRSLEELGIEVELKSVDSGVFFSSDVGNPDTAAHFYADLEMFTNGPTSPYPIDYMLAWWGEPSNIAQRSNNWAGNNYERWQNDEYDELYRQAQTELDEDRQIELFTQMNKLVVENVVVIPQVARRDVQAHASDLRNLEISDWTSNLWNLVNWTRE